LSRKPVADLNKIAVRVPEIDRHQVADSTKLFGGPLDYFDTVCTESLYDFFNRRFGHDAEVSTVWQRFFG